MLVGQSSAERSAAPGRGLDAHVATTAAVRLSVAGSSNGNGKRHQDEGLDKMLAEIFVITIN